MLIVNYQQNRAKEVKIAKAIGKSSYTNSFLETPNFKIQAPEKIQITEQNNHKGAM